MFVVSARDDQEWETQQSAYTQSCSKEGSTGLSPRCIHKLTYRGQRRPGSEICYLRLRCIWLRLYIFRLVCCLWKVFRTAVELLAKCQMTVRSLFAITDAFIPYECRLAVLKLIYEWNLHIRKKFKCKQEPDLINDDYITIFRIVSKWFYDSETDSDTNQYKLINV